MVVLYIGIKKVWGFLPKNLTEKSAKYYFPTAWQHWLGIAKPKNVTLNLCVKLLKNFLFNRFFY